MLSKRLSSVNFFCYNRGGGVKHLGKFIYRQPAQIIAPFSGTVKFFASPGVIGLESFGGVELLIHVGLKTCKFVGETFKPQVAAGDVITRGQVLLTFDPQEISRAGFDATTPVVVTNPENFGDIVFNLGGQKIFAQRESCFFTLKEFLCYNLRGGVEYA
ncbi:MAG: PTS glucose transporter subunit IIA [Quinella sp. 3Q1]|nr:PTS glucose transporter subunit IIA [Quinella sp. 3Q1]MBR3049860.1 PTS glucose transporter subunit IIA [Selenomonadaceae bacterium]MBR6886905.1 PTS glucose transporter subunit IIA [Selenomonadaceae bacterium]